MDSSSIQKLPLVRLPPPFADAKRVRDLTTLQVRELLRQAQVRFFIADVGHPLRMVETSSCHDFWKHDAKLRIVDTPFARLEDYAETFCYFASEWSDGGLPIVLLSVAH